MGIKELPSSERPYEKLEMYGENFLSNAELLAIIIKTGTKEFTSIEIAQKILSLEKNNKIGTLRFLQELSIEELTKIKGIGKIKAIQIKAVCELAKRMSRPIEKINIQIRTSDDVADLLMEEMKYERKEIAKVLILNNKNEILKIKDVSLGGSNRATFEPKEVLVDAVKMGAPKIILVHNHPSGDPTPSEGDYEATERVYSSAEMLGIQMLDHVVIGDGKYSSVFSKLLKMNK